MHRQTIMTISKNIIFFLQVFRKSFPETCSKKILPCHGGGELDSLRVVVHDHDQGPVDVVKVNLHQIGSRNIGSKTLQNVVLEAKKVLCIKNVHNKTN